jgi:hypothetical protein
VDTESDYGLREERNLAAFERHYSVPELAELWNLSDSTIIRMFRDEPGVIALGTGTRLLHRKYVRRYFVLRIPESVALRVHNGLLPKGLKSID